MNRLILTLTLVSFPVVAWTEPPWDVDDPGVTPKGMLTLYEAYRHIRASGGRSEAISVLAVTYGLTARTELGLNLDFLRESAAEGGRLHGVSDLSLAAKHLLRGSSEMPELSVVYQFSMPTGSRWATSGKMDHGAWLTGQTPLGNMRLTWNLGANYFESTKTWSPIYGIVVDYAASRLTEVGVQLHGAGPQFKGDRSEFQVGVGMRYQASVSVNVQAMIGRGFQGKADAAVFIGVTWDVQTRKRP